MMSDCIEWNIMLCQYCWKYRGSLPSYRRARVFFFTFSLLIHWNCFGKIFLWCICFLAMLSIKPTYCIWKFCCLVDMFLLAQWCGADASRLVRIWCAFRQLIHFLSASNNFPSYAQESVRQCCEEVNIAWLWMLASEEREVIRSNSNSKVLSFSLAKSGFSVAGFSIVSGIWYVSICGKVRVLQRQC